MATGRSPIPFSGLGERSRRTTVVGSSTYSVYEGDDLLLERYYGVRPFLALYDWPDPAGYFIRRAIEDKADRYALANRRAVPSLVDCPDAKPLALPGGGF